MKVLSLHASFSSFFSACFRAAVVEQGFEIYLVCSKPSSFLHFSDEIYHCSKVKNWQFREDIGVDGIRQLVEEFKPDAIITSGWMYSDYLKVCKEFRKSGGIVIAFSDTQFKGRLKQRIGCLLSRWLLHPSIDQICVAGERQREYAHRLGFKTDQICEPALCCDWNRFSNARKSLNFSSKAFIYVGRMLKIKGVDLLIQAYQIYCSRVAEPWMLKLVGSGPEAKDVKNVEGVNYLGFVQPSNLPEIMREGCCFILPSRSEPWGVVLQEAAALGLPLIATDACGASVHLLRDGINGYLAETGSIESLALQMQRIHCKKDSELEEMGEVSYKLSQQYLPSYWAKMLASTIKDSISKRVL